MSCYLGILVSLLVFYCVILLYTKCSCKANFRAVPASLMLFEPATQEIYLNDTRTKFAEIPPVNPNVLKSEVLNVVPANMYSLQDYSVEGYLLDQPVKGSTNQLTYSGGNAELIRIPLQFNAPFDEQLRSQEILITDYNRIKYSSNCKNA